MVIALDGPAASGKSTIARLLAKKLKIVHLDSGALYRTLTLALMKKIGKEKSPKEFGEKLEAEEPDIEGLDCDFLVLDSKQVNRISGEEVAESLRTPEVTERITYIANNLKCRDWVNKRLRKLSKKVDLIIDGRDIGTLVFPDASFKFFLEASVAVRARRRLDDLKKMGHNISLKKLEKKIEKRDRDDSSRPVGALKKAQDAIPIESSQKSPEEILSQILSYLNSEKLSPILQ